MFLNKFRGFPLSCPVGWSAVGSEHMLLAGMEGLGKQPLTTLGFPHFCLSPPLKNCLAFYKLKN